MKKLFIICTLAILCALDASAQWYLFPGKRKANKEKATPKQELIIDTQKDSIIPDEALFAAGEDSVLINTEYIFQKADPLKIALILPFHNASKPNPNFIDMYNGALIALRQFAQCGEAVELQAIEESEFSAYPDVFSDSHIVLGPVNMESIMSSLDLISKEGYLISPLEPKASVFVDSCRIVQAPVQWQRQIEEVVDWISEDYNFEDKIVVIKDSTDLGEQSQYLIKSLRASNRAFELINNASQLNPNKFGLLRCVIASDRDAFINATVRDLSVLVNTKKDYNCILYGNSKLRNSLGVSIEHLHNLNTHYTTAYHIDYDQASAEAFILAYRALFKTEPGQFAFQGYDIMNYFLKLYSEFGVQWYKKLDEFPQKGIQNDYKFINEGRKGWINTAVRRVILQKDLSTSLQ